MKKLFVFVAILFVLSGCDNTDSSLMTMTCNSKNNRNGISSQTKYDFKYEDDKIKYITLTYHYRDNNTNDDIDGINADTDGLDEDNSTNNGNNNTNNNARNREATNGTTNYDMNGNTNGTTGGTTTDGTSGNTNGTTGGTTNNVDNGTTTRNGNTGTTNNDAGLSSDEVVDGIIGDTIDGVINTFTDTIYDIAGLRTVLERQYAMYDNIAGLSYDVDTSSDTEYKVVFKIDMDVISDDDLASFNLDRNLDNVRDNYEGLGYTCR